MIEPENAVAAVEDLHRRLVSLDHDGEFVGVQRRWAAVYRSLSARDTSHLSARVEGDFPGQLRLVVESTHGHWSSRPWEVIVTAAMERGREGYSVERTDLRALTRGWLGEDVTVDVRTQSVRDGEWYAYHFEPYAAWTCVFARAAWEAWTHVTLASAGRGFGGALPTRTSG